jgi:hypothetical protein
MAMSDVLNESCDFETDVAEVGERLPFALPLDLTISDPDTIRELLSYPEGEERERFALNALRIGVLALRQARGQIDADLVRRESERLLTELGGRLSDHAVLVHDRVAESLKQYFDPTDGRLPERIDRLVRKDGELESLLRRQIGTEDSQLTKTLAAHVGEESPLMKALSPDQSRGVLCAIRKTVEDQLQSQRDQVLGQFSLDNKEGALSRFIAELTRRHGDLSEELHVKIDKAVHEFSLDDESSALSRLVGRVDDAHRKIASQFSLDDEQSALARMKRELQLLINDHRQDSQRFQEEVKGALQAMAARKQEADRSTRHGLAFEAAVFEFLQNESQRLGDVATSIGQTTGHIDHCKVGDAQIELGPESAAPGSSIVVEAKEENKLNLVEARAEIERGRKNRGADVGLFVFSKRTAPKGLESLFRAGGDVFVVWDAEDAQTDPFFRAAVSLARALCIRQRAERESQAVDFHDIDEAILAVEKQAGSLEEVEDATRTIQRACEKIVKRIGIARKAFEKQVTVLTEKTADLKATLGKEA